MKNNVDVVLDLIKACNNKDIDAALALFHEGSIYDNIPLSPVTGLTAIRAALEPSLRIAKQVQWVVHHIAASDKGTVLTERTDRFLLASGWCEMPVMGTFEVNDGKIDAWRDYFDMQAAQPLMAALQAS
ncbi:MAG TPA: limonene-1,2-epoxide hydrolase family protein [Spongiibacteraceae bacterium]|nr:limonene-1,2-epoxide hydrolase family protein [Spongiibacteraceae bacterium]